MLGQALHVRDSERFCQEANEWWAQHPEAAQRQVADYHQREDIRVSMRADRGSSAA